jgi:hypothetical protein
MVAGPAAHAAATLIVTGAFSLLPHRPTHTAAWIPMAASIA